MPTSYGFVTGKVPSTKGKAKTGDVTGSISKPTIVKQDFDAGLQVNNRDQFAGKNNATNPQLGYAYAQMVEVAPVNPEATPRSGAPSLFSEYAIVVHPGCNEANDFFDIKGENGAFPQFSELTGTEDRIDAQGQQYSVNIGRGGRNVSEESLIEHGPPYGYIKNGKGDFYSPTPYYASDFIFCKYHRKIPLNHQITLRRYPFPTFDSLDTDGNQVFKPIAQAVTYLGEPTGNNIKDLTKFSGVINWEEMTADVWDTDGEEVGTDGSPFFDKLNSSKPKIANGLKYGAAALGQSSDQNSGAYQSRQEQAKLLNDPNFTNEYLGPVNVINKTNIRARGIGANAQITLTFEYELRSFSGINPRLAMVDLLCNMLALTFNNAKFWGGANRYFPKYQQFGFIGDQEKFYSGDYKGYFNSVGQQAGDLLGKGMNLLSGLLGNLFSGNFGGVADIAKGIGTSVMDFQAAKSRPKVVGLRALLSGLPVGEWHMIAGNPYRPFMTMGNLIVKNFDFEFDGPMSADDMPSNLKFVINLEQGRPRDKGDLESIFSLGQGRVYNPQKGIADVQNMSSSTGTRITPNTGGNNNNPAKSGSTNAFGQPVEKKPIYQSRGTYDLTFAQKLSGSLY